jgi:dTDP-4-dehydrorhamnose 3,5-epimerase
MKFTTTSIPDVILIEPQVRGDSRGFFMETFQARHFAQAGIPTNFVQDNHSGSLRGILRGLHYQIQQAQGKLVRVVAGEVFDVAVDLRKSSTTFGHWVGTTLSVENRHTLWVPEGFAHGFYVISEWAELVYKATDYYAPEWERTLCWNDEAVGVQWPVPPGEVPLLSEKDSRGKALSECDLFA